MRPVLFVLLAAVCFGTTGTAQALGPSTDPLALGAARIAVGGLALALVAVLVARRQRRPVPHVAPAPGVPPVPHVAPPPGVPPVPDVLREPTVPASPDGPRSGLAAPAPPRRVRAAAGRIPRVPPGTLGILALGVLGVLAYQPAFFLGTSRNGVAVGTVIALGSAPVLTGLLTWATRRERPRAAWLVATALATAGVTVLGLTPGEASTGAGGLDPVGVAASLGAGAAYALYTLAGAALIDKGWTSTTSMGAVFGVAGALSVGILLVTDAPGLTTPAGVATVLWLGLVTTTMAYVLFGSGLARLGAPTVATLTLAEPLTATVLGLAVLGERLVAGAVVGLVVLGAGLLVLAAGARVRRPAVVVPV